MDEVLTVQVTRWTPLVSMIGSYVLEIEVHTDLKEF